jgi:two-component sensor histidine kinase
VFHELATNAAKYGAIANGSGRILVAWNLQQAAGEDWVEIEWHEQGGPPVAVPERRGFGSQLIDQSVQQIGGVSRFNYAPGGLVCILRFPLRRPPSETL